MQMPSITAQFRRPKQVELVRFSPFPPKGLKDLKINHKNPLLRASAKQTNCQPGIIRLFSPLIACLFLSIYFNIPFHGLTFLESRFSLSLLFSQQEKQQGFWLSFTVYISPLFLLFTTPSPTILLTPPESEWTVSRLVTCSFGMSCWPSDLGKIWEPVLCMCCYEEMGALFFFVWYRLSFPLPASPP